MGAELLNAFEPALISQTMFRIVLSIRALANLRAQEPMAISIPTGAIKGFSLISDLSEKNFKALLVAIRNIPDGSAPSNIRRDFKIESLDPDDVYWMGKTIYSFGSLLDKPDTTSEKISRDLLNAYTGNKEAPEIPAGKRKTLLARLKTILDAAGIVGFNYRAVHLSTAVQKGTIDMRIITDLRYVFDSGELKKMSDKAVVIHNLRITFRENDEDKTLYFGLDSSDLETMKAIVERAQQKEALMKRTKGLTIID